jgi:hypothetical protein
MFGRNDDRRWKLEGKEVEVKGGGNSTANKLQTTYLRTSAALDFLARCSRLGFVIVKKEKSEDGAKDCRGLGGGLGGRGSGKARALCLREKKRKKKKRVSCEEGWQQPGLD